MTNPRKIVKGIDDLYATKVKLEELLYLTKKMTRLHDDGEKPGFEAAAFILSERYRGKKNAVGKAFAIMERMNALARLMKMNDERMRGWTMDTIEPECMLTNDAVFKATAICPLRKDSEQRVSFDADEFFEIVLKEADVKGRA
jgi:hypothetical protein